MPDPLHPVSPGDISPFVNDFATVQKSLELLRGLDGKQLGGMGGQFRPRDDPAQTVVWVRNDTGADLPAFSVVALGTPVISAVDYPHDVRRRPIFPGTAPAASTDAFAVTLEPLPHVPSQGRRPVGLAAVLGTVPVDVNVTSSAHTFAAPSAGVTNKLTSAASGPAQIIWRETGSSGTKRAVVLLSGPQASVVPAADVATTFAHVLSSDATWEDSGVSITLPAAGTYFIFCVVSGQAQVSALPAGPPPSAAYIAARLYDVTNSAALPGSFVLVVGCEVVNRQNSGSAPIMFITTVASGITIRLEGWRQFGPTWTQSEIASSTDAGGYLTHLGYLKVG